MYGSYILKKTLTNNPQVKPSNKKISSLARILVGSCIIWVMLIRAKLRMHAVITMRVIVLCRLVCEIALSNFYSIWKHSNLRAVTFCDFITKF